MREILSRIGAIGGKEFIHIRRDPRMIAAILIVPVVQLVLFAYAISFDVRNIPTVTLDLDKTSASRAYLNAYQQSGFFNVVGSVDSLAAVDRAFKTNSARAAVVVGPDFAAKMAANEKGSVQVLFDGSEPNSAQLGQAYAAGLNNTFNQQALAAFAQRENIDASQLGRLEPRLRTWYNPERRAPDFLVPGLMAVIIMIVTVQQTAVTLVRERDNGTMQQMLVSPMHRWELMVGKLVPWAFLGFIDTIGITLAAVFIFRVPLRGDLVLLLVSMFLFIIACLGIGLIISARAKSIESANIIALLISFLPSFMLSGFAFPISSVPVVLQWASYLFPGRYMVSISRAVFLKGAGWPVLWPQVAALAIYSLVAIALASALYGRESQ